MSLSYAVRWYIKANLFSSRFFCFCAWTCQANCNTEVAYMFLFKKKNLSLSSNQYPLFLKSLVYHSPTNISHKTINNLHSIQTMPTNLPQTFHNFVFTLLCRFKLFIMDVYRKIVTPRPLAGCECFKDILVLSLKLFLLIVIYAHHWFILNYITQSVKNSDWTILLLTEQPVL